MPPRRQPRGTPCTRIPRPAGALDRGRRHLPRKRLRRHENMPMERVTRHRAVERSDVERSNPQDAERMRYSEGQAATARTTCTIPSGHATPYDGERQRVDAGPDSRRMTSKYRTGNDGRRADDSGRSLPQAPIGRQIRSTPQLDFARNQKSANISKDSGTKTELSHLFVCEAFAS